MSSAPLYDMTISGIPEVIANFELLEKLLIKELIESTDFSTIKVRDFARANHPYQDRTGNLTHSINMVPAKVEGAFIVGKVFAGMAYAAPVEFGTRRTKPYPYMIPALMANEKDITQAYEGGVKRACDVVGAAGAMMGRV